MKANLKLTKRIDGAWVIQGNVVIDDQHYPVCEVVVGEKPSNLKEVAIKSIKRNYKLKGGMKEK